MMLIKCHILFLIAFLKSTYCRYTLQPLDLAEAILISRPVYNTCLYKDNNKIYRISIIKGQLTCSHPVLILTLTLNAPTTR